MPSTSALLHGSCPLPKPSYQTAQTTIPAFLYGTAWKKESTTTLVQQALQSGFTAVDTAAQPKHYREDLVAQGLKNYLQQTGKKREDIFIQTKYTPPSGQDLGNIPYDPTLSIPDQVHASIKSSLHNFTICSQQEPYVDSLILHSPLSTPALTLSAWRILESFVPHSIHHLGISNTTLPVLSVLYSSAVIKPSVVQNRFYPSTGYDVAVRKFCVEHGIVYQSFWTLTANPELLKSKVVRAVADKVGVEVQVALYALVLGLGNVVVLNGTTRVERMRGDLEWLERVRKWVGEGKEREWESWMVEFRGLIREN